MRGSVSRYMHVFRALFLAAIVAASVGSPLSAQPGGDRATSIRPGESCPPATTEIRVESLLAVAPKNHDSSTTGGGQCCAAVTRASASA